MEFESTNSNTTAKLPIPKLGEYEMWVIRIKQYFQIQDYALWEVIENGNSWVSVPPNNHYEKWRFWDWLSRDMADEQVSGQTWLLMGFQTLNLDEFKEPEFKGYGTENSKQESNVVCDKKLDDSKKNSDNSLVKEQVSKDTSSFVESIKPKNHEKPVKKSVRVNYNYTTKRTHPNDQRNMVPNELSFNENLAYKNFYTARTVNTGKPQQDDTGFIDSGCSRHMTGNIAYLLDFKEFDRGERRNRTLIEAARTMLADSKLHITFWAEAVSTACYVHNRVLVVKPHNKTPYELFRENKPMIERNGPKWLFAIDSLTQSRNYVPVAASTIINESTGTQEELNAGTSEKISQDCIVMPIWKDASYFDSPTQDVDNGEPKSTAVDQKQDGDGLDNGNDEQDKSNDDSSPKEVNATGQHVNTASPDVTTGSFKLNVVGPSVNTTRSYDQDSPKDMFTMGASHTLEATHVEFFSDEDEPEVDLGNIINSYTVPNTLNTRIHKNHPIENMIGDVKSTIEPTSIAKALFDSSWVKAMQEELLLFKSNRIWYGLEKIMKDMFQMSFMGRTYFLSRITSLQHMEDVNIYQVGDEAVHKELGDRMERAATTTSSLEAEQDSEVLFGKKLKLVLFWATAKANTVNGERQLQALIDKKKVIITESSIISDLHSEKTAGVLDLEKAKDAQAKEIADLKKRVQKLERQKKSRTTGLKRLRKVGMSTRVESSKDKDIDDIQRRVQRKEGYDTSDEDFNKEYLKIQKMEYHDFLNGKISEEVYVQQPPGFESSEFPDHVWKLDKARCDLLKKYDLADSASVKFPMLPLNNLGPDESGVNETLYQANPKESHLVVQSLVAMSSAEAEYVAAVRSCAQVLWIKSQLADYDVLLIPVNF
ncbi:putative ribonuclease H-like domain-containing protein [Tanacetum coccineum]